MGLPRYKICSIRKRWFFPGVKLILLMRDFMYINYTSIYDSVIGFYKSQLFTIQPKSETISGRELDTDGLEGKQITSVSEYGDDMVYVTTMSGGYYRSKESFFDSINED
jgi:hypothetical protein